MENADRLMSLRADARMQWSRDDRAWRAEPDEIVGALTSAGFAEYRREEARTLRGKVAGGVWQGLDPRTGKVASAIWVVPGGNAPALVFIDIDGEGVAGEAA
jgi:hypothetical protein